MTRPSLDELFAVEARLNRAFFACVSVIGALLVWIMVMAKSDLPEEGTLLWVGMGLGVLLLAAYVWYAIAAGAAAGVLGQTTWHYVTWTLLAPPVSLLPLGIVSTLIAVSPLSIKFLLGNQLKTEIRERSLAD